MMRIENTVGLVCDEIVYDFASSCWGWGSDCCRKLCRVRVRCSFAGRSAFYYLALFSKIYHFNARKRRNAHGDSKAPREGELEANRGSNGRSDGNRSTIPHENKARGDWCHDRDHMYVRESIFKKGQNHLSLPGTMYKGGPKREEM